ncbi:MAG: hypothetical protein B9S32_00185 [Verrucomicrobia bacterium Tous-C9LFEB]|nr:MAG: hypothetical protein B9S32_00185 [Verrucomicrobia bacterium Tous-C9LFEB]
MIVLLLGGLIGLWGVATLIANCCWRGVLILSILAWALSATIILWLVYGPPDQQVWLQVQGPSELFYPYNLIMLAVGCFVTGLLGGILWGIEKTKNYYSRKRCL